MGFNMFQHLINQTIQPLHTSTIQQFKPTKKQGAIEPKVLVFCGLSLAKPPLVSGKNGRNILIWGDKLS